METTKTCIICKEAKLLDTFAISKGYYANQCRDCENIKRREKRAKKTSGEIVIMIDPINNMICDYCHVETSKTLFRPNSRKCKDCLKIERLAYTQSEHGKQKSAEWYQKNRENIAKSQAEWHQRNREKLNEKYNQRYRLDPEFRFKQLCTKRIQGAFRDKGMQKSNKTVSYLNSSISWLIGWLKFCFSLEMTMENHGEHWHMDHVIPVNTFNLNDPKQVELCFSWYNLSPLKASENLSKSDTINVQQIKQHVQNLVYFNKQHYNIETYIDLCARHLIKTGSPLELYLPLQ